MQTYDVVLLLDAKLSDTERKQMIDEIEKNLGKSIMAKDEIWLHALAYNLGQKVGEDKAYFLSYHVQASADQILEFKKQLIYNKAIKRYVIYKLTGKDQFFVFADLQKELNQIIEGWDQKKLWQKLSFFMDKNNAKYLNWKSLPMLQKYVSRFGNIKPRKYTGNSVGIQKKLREAILRARGLGVLAYAKK